MKTPVRHTDTPADLSGADRDRHKRSWIERNLRKLSGRGIAGGLVSTLLALPAFAQATVEELYAFQFADTIPGVKSAKLMDNGDVLLQMLDGRTMVVAAEHVQVLESGSIMIAEAMVSQIVEFSAVAEAGAASAAGGLGGMGAAAAGLGLAGAAAAGGGGGGGGDDPAPTPNFPALNLAELQATSLNNTLTNATAPDDATSVEVTIGSVTKTVTPDSEGNWTVTLTAPEASALAQGQSTVTVRMLDTLGDEISVSTATVVVDTIPPTLSIDSFSNGAVMNAAEQGTDLVVSGATDAENGQSVSVTLNGQTYTGTVSNGQWSATVPAADLAALSDGATINVTADVSDRAGNPAVQASNSFDTDFTAPTITLDPVGGGSIDLIDVTGDLTVTGATSAEDNQTVTLVLDGQSFTGTTLGGSWSVTIPNADLAGLTTGTPAEISVSLTDAAGNPATTVTATVPVDLSGPSIAISPLSVGDILNAAEAGSDLTISGTTGNVGDNQQVSVTLNGQTYTDLVSGGSWSVTVPTADLAFLSDGGDFTITANVSDADGLAAPQATAQLAKDVSAPTVTIDSFSDGAVMNAAERGTDLTISGSTTAEDDQTVTVGMNGLTYTAEAAGGSWTVTVPAADLALLADGTTIAVTADVSDIAENPAVQATGSFDTDFTDPTIAITGVSDGSIMNATERATDLTISGTSDAGVGAVVSITIARADGTVDISETTTVTVGNWTLVTNASDLLGLQDQESYTITATVADAAGNTSQTTMGFITDFAAPSITLDPLSIGSVLDVVERGQDLTVSGTTTADNGDTVTINLDGETYTATAMNGSWSADIPTGDLAALADSTSFQISASVEDAAGNTSNAATGYFSTDFRPTLNLDSIGTNGAISLANAQSSGITVSGSSVGLAAGQAVDILLGSTSVGTATVAANGTWSAPIAASAFAGTTAGTDLSFSAEATVSGGPDPLPVSADATAHTPAAYVISEVGRSGSTVQFAVYSEADRDLSSGLFVDMRLEFDSAQVTFDSGSIIFNGQLPLAVNAANPSFVNFAGATLSFSDISAPLVQFSVDIQDINQPFELKIVTPNGGDSVYQSGTTTDDVIGASNVDTIIRGGDGDDTIDLTEAGRDIVVFEADPAINGTDIITGFSTGTATEVADTLMFRGLDVATLRGTGTDVEFLSQGGNLGIDTGFVGFTTILSDLTVSTIELSLESLVGAQAGDEIYALTTDGTDAKLVKASFSASDDVTVDTLAVFDGLNDLNNLSADNILHTDPTGATA